MLKVLFAPTATDMKDTSIGHVCGYASTSKLFIKEYTIKNACKDFIETDYNTPVTVDEPRQMYV